MKFDFASFFCYLILLNRILSMSKSSFLIFLFLIFKLDTKGNNMKQKIKQLLSKEVITNKNRDIVHENFSLRKTVKNNRMDFMFYPPNSNNRFAYFSVYFDGANLRLHKDFINGTVFQEGVFNLFLNVIREVASQEKTLIINTIRKNRYYL